MLRDLVSTSARVFLSVDFISLTNYTHLNQTLCNYDKVMQSPTSAPVIDLNCILTLIHSKMLVSTFIFNQYSQNINVVLRNGVRQTIPPVDYHFSNQVIIRNVYVVDKHNGPQLDKFFYETKQEATHHPEFNIIRDQYLEFKKSHPNDHMIIVIDAVLDGQLIDQYRSIYVHNRDLVISIEPIDIAPHHPFDSFESSKEYAEKLLENKEGYGVVIDIVDNKQTCGDKYFYMGGRIYSVHPRKDNNRDDGVYLFETYTTPHHERKTSVKYYTYEEAKTQLQLYDSHEEALRGTNLQAHREKELEDKKHENSLLKMQHEKLKIEHENLSNQLKSKMMEQDYVLKKQISELEQKYKEIEFTRKREQEQWDRERLNLQRELEREKYFYDREDYRRKDQYERRKDYYEERSYIRKDNSELLKFVPVFLTAAVGIWAYASKK